MSSKRASTTHIKKLIHSDKVQRLEDDLEELLKSCPLNEREKILAENKSFVKIYFQFLKTSEKPISWDEVEPFPSNALLEYDNLLKPSVDLIKDMLGKLVVVKLNGGLGTRMKCSGPKSLIQVRSGLNFLDLTVQQIENLNTEYNTNVPLVLMNSFNTEEETEVMIKKYQNLKTKIYTFNQSRYPRIHAENHDLLSTSYDANNKAMWYPPGHGDFYESFVRSQLLEKFQSSGKELCFVSNIDNLAATVDFRILDMIKSTKRTKLPEFLMEVTKKTAADTKGGTLIQYRGKLKLLEYAEVPRDYIEDFKCAEKFTTFNTNNLWINLDAIKKVVTNNSLSLDVIPNRKLINMNSENVEVIQLETAAGAAIGVFNDALGIMVPRSRFLPVKTTSDLFLLRSDVYINHNGKLMMNPLRPFKEVPIVSLAGECFEDYRALEKRFEKIPDCLKLHHLTVCGDIYFAREVVLKGNVAVLANQGERMDIPRGSVLKSKIVTGSLRIVDF